jgi:hypothetical protein
VSFAELFDDVLPDAVTVEPWTGQNPNGGATYGPAVAIARARVVRGSKMFRDDRGQQVLSIATLYAGASEVRIGPKDRVTLPDGTQPPILGSPSVYPDESGDLVQTVHFGRAG